MGVARTIIITMRLLVLIAIVALSKASIDGEFEEFADRWFGLIGKDADGLISATEISAFNMRYDNKDVDPQELSIYESDYKTSSSNGNSATDQFRIPANFAAAYFKLQDLVDIYDIDYDGFCRLTEADSEVAVLLGDDDFDDKLNETEFKWGFKRILRGASSALLYVNKRSSEGTNRYDDLWSYDDWVALFTDISNGDDIFTVNDFIPFWTGGANPYGGEAQARAVFDIFDLERSFFINRLEWDALFVLFDWDGDEMLGVEEMLTIDYYLNEGAGLRLGDKSFVGTKEGHINRMLDSKRN